MAPGVTLYSNHLGEQLPYDGVSPVTWRVASYVLALRDGKMLVIESPVVSRWELPGGGVEPHERVLDAAIRECWEETGYRFIPADDNPICIAEWNYLPPGTKQYRQSLMLAFQGAVEGDPDPAWQLNPDEVRQVCWLEPSALTGERNQLLLKRALRAAGLQTSSEQQRREQTRLGRVAPL